jgi:hypothetical protein
MKKLIITLSIFTVINLAILALSLGAFKLLVALVSWVLEPESMEIVGVAIRLC